MGALFYYNLPTQNALFSTKTNAIFIPSPRKQRPMPKHQPFSLSFLFYSDPKNIRKRSDYQLFTYSFSLQKHKKHRFSTTYQKKKIKVNYNACTSCHPHTPTPLQLPSFAHASEARL
jgi:hypothetical protein